MEKERRDKWLIAGEKTSKFFQASVKSQRERNAMNMLLDENGVESFLEKEKGEAAVKYLGNLFSTSETMELESFCSGFQARVSSAMNEVLENG